jgi:hypothetical protein
MTVDPSDLAAEATVAVVVALFNMGSIQID